jgi:hypothetical protein
MHPVVVFIMCCLIFAIALVGREARDRDVSIDLNAGEDLTPKSILRSSSRS